MAGNLQSCVFLRVTAQADPAPEKPAKTHPVWVPGVISPVGIPGKGGPVLPQFPSAGN